MYSLESPHRGDSNKYTQHTIIIEKIEKTSLNYIHLPSDLWGGGHIDFVADPVGVGVTIPCLHNILLHNMLDSYLIFVFI